MSEINWRPVYGYTELYEVSDSGIVRSAITKKWLAPFNNGTGYDKVILHKPLAKRKSCYVHRLVAKAFIPNPSKRPQVNHLDGNKKNNKASNLEWVTARQNFQHAKENGLLIRQKSRPLKDIEIMAISVILNFNPLANARDISRILGIDTASIQESLLAGEPQKFTLV